MRADLAVFDTSGTAFATHDDPISSLVLSSYDHRARLVMVGGRVVVRDGTVQTLDEQSTIDKADHAHRRLLARNQPYSQLARAQEMFLTQLSATAPATREIITFEAPAPRTR
jgi:5-methylthioadenosine/S-adenosylhomocysteine deaminase